MICKKVGFGKQQPFSHNQNGAQPGVWDASSSHAASAEDVQHGSGCSVISDLDYFLRGVSESWVSGSSCRVITASLSPPPSQPVLMHCLRTRGEEALEVLAFL